MTTVSYDLARLSQSFGGERRQAVTILRMRGKREHFAAEAQEADVVSVVPADHFGNITDVREANGFEVALAELDVGALASIRPIFYGMLWLRGVLEGMAVLKD